MRKSSCRIQGKRKQQQHFTNSWAKSLLKDSVFVVIILFEKHQSGEVDDAVLQSDLFSMWEHRQPSIWNSPDGQGSDLRGRPFSCLLCWIPHDYKMLCILGKALTLLFVAYAFVDTCLAPAEEAWLDSACSFVGCVLSMWACPTALQWEITMGMCKALIHPK